MTATDCAEGYRHGIGENSAESVPRTPVTSALDSRSVRMSATNLTVGRPRADAIAGSLLGTAVGDAVGLPVEGLSRERQRRLFGPITGQRLMFRRGMVSDDTEHAILVAQALIRSGGDPESFSRTLARQLRIWFALLPAGIGFATLRACLKLCVGVPPDRSGVYSAGNGPAMRAALIGVRHGADTELVKRLIRVSSRITHTDPRAEEGALAVALAAHLSATGCLRADDFAARWRALSPDEADGELGRAIDAACRAAATGMSTPDFAASIGLARGVSGYICHTVPVALHASLRYPSDLRAAVLGAIACGGDTDSVAAVVGGIVGAGVGKGGIPADWLAGLAEWPRTVRWMEHLADRLGTVDDVVPGSVGIPGGVGRMLPVFLSAVIVRNLLFLTVVLYHGARRLLPPY